MGGKVIIYGGYGGIGLAVARALRDRGYRCHLVGRNDERLAAAAREVDATRTTGDVLDPDLFPRATEEAGASLAGLVYAVGTLRLGGIRRLTAEDYMEDFRVNAVGAALAVRAALAALKKHEGRSSVVLFSSVAVRQGFAMHASIGMSKGAVAGLALSLAAELAPAVRVNAVAPSLTRTPLAEPLLKNEKVAAGIAARHAAGRLGEPGDIASLVAFLVSEDADWITGQVIGVDGGRSTLRTEG